MLGDCITTSVYERNTKVIQSSYISKVNELRNAVPNAVMPIWWRMAFALAISLPIGGKKVILRMKVRCYKCKCADCDDDCRERISFPPGRHSYTRRFATSDEPFFALRRGVGRGSTSAKILTTRRASARCETSRT